jgi:hypothetical protein
MDDINNNKKGSPDKVTTDQSINSEDEWNLDSLRLDQSFDQMIGAEQVVTTVPVRKPLSQEFFRIHSDPSWRLQVALLQIRDENEVFIVERNLWTDLWEEISPAMLFMAVSRDGAPFLWPVRLPKDGRIDRFNESDMKVVTAARKNWVRRYWVPEIKSHKVLATTKLTMQPVWPEIGFEEVVKIAFKDRRIKSLDHPAIKRLRGEV